MYRQRQIFLRAGVDLSRSTLSDWIGRCGVELEPLANALKQVVLQQQVIHADETPVTVMQMGENEKKPKKRLCLGLCQHTVQSSSGSDL